MAEVFVTFWVFHDKSAVPTTCFLMEVINPAASEILMGYVFDKVNVALLGIVATILEYIADPPVVIIIPSPDKKSRLNDASGQVNVNGEALL